MKISKIYNLANLYNLRNIRNFLDVINCECRNWTNYQENYMYFLSVSRINTTCNPKNYFKNINFVNLM